MERRSAGASPTGQIQRGGIDRTAAAGKGHAFARYGKVYGSGEATLIRPLPEHGSQGAGYILRPGFVGCVTGGNPVPLQAEQIFSVQTSFGSGVFIDDPLFARSGATRLSLLSNGARIRIPVETGRSGGHKHDKGQTPSCPVG
jgi:hypothetical protein